MSSQNSNGKKAHEKIPQASPTDVQGRKRMNENGDDEEHNDFPPFLRSEEGSDSDSGSGSAGGLDASMNEGEGDGNSSDLTKTSEDVAEEEKGEDNQAQEQKESQENSKDRSSQAKSVIEESGDTAQGQENSQDDGEGMQENQNQDQDDDPEKNTSSEQDENDESMPEDRAQEQQQPETEESNGKMEPQSNAAVEEESGAKIDTSTKENTKPLSSPSSALEDFSSKFQSSLLKKRPSSILRTSVKNPTSGKRRASVSFADENGGIISEQQTISVSPSKLSRRVRRGRALPSAYEPENEEEEEKVQKGLMGRVLVLLMDPPTKQYELTSLPYPLVSNENGIIGPTPLNILLSLVAKSASYEPLKQKTYTAFMRPDDKEAMNNALNILDYKFVKDEVLIAIPEGFGAEECSKFSKPILLDKRLVRLLKKLKKHERKAEKKRRLKTLSMKPSRFEQLADGTYAERNVLGMGTGSGTDADGEIPSEERRRGGNGGIGIKWSSSLVSIILIVLLACMSAGSLSVFQQKKINEEVLYSQSMERNKDLCGKGAFCKPFGVKPDSQKQNKSVLMGRLREGIRKWNLEDDLML